MTDMRAAGMTLQDIADTSGVAPNTVRSTLQNCKVDDAPATVVGKDGKARPTTYKPRQTEQPKPKGYND